MLNPVVSRSGCNAIIVGPEVRTLDSEWESLSVYRMGERLAEALTGATLGEMGDNERLVS